MAIEGEKPARPTPGIVNSKRWHMIRQPIVGIRLVVEFFNIGAANDGDICYGVCEQALSRNAALVRSYQGAAAKARGNAGKQCAAVMTSREFANASPRSLKPFPSPTFTTQVGSGIFIFPLLDMAAILVHPIKDLGDADHKMI
jgi:hypothetical protein